MFQDERFTNQKTKDFSDSRTRPLIESPLCNKKKNQSSKINQNKQGSKQNKGEKERQREKKKRVSENGANEWKAKFENMEKQKMGN